MENKMFCFQCQETAGCTGCTQVGVCGKKPDVAAMQDLLVYVTKGLSAVTTQLRGEGEEADAEVNHLIILNLFTTITNANFDKDAIAALIKATLDVKRNLAAKVKRPEALPEAALWDGGEADYEAKAAVGSRGCLLTLSMPTLCCRRTENWTPSFSVLLPLRLTKV